MNGNGAARIAVVLAKRNRTSCSFKKFLAEESAVLTEPTSRIRIAESHGCDFPPVFYRYIRRVRFLPPEVHE